MGDVYCKGNLPPMQLPAAYRPSMGANVFCARTWPWRSQNMPVSVTRPPAMFPSVGNGMAK